MNSTEAANPSPRKHTLIIAGSLIGGLVAAVVLVAIPFVDSRESVVTGAILLGFAFGWALLGGLSRRFSDRPQRWAAIPATAMGITAVCLLVIAPGPAALTTLGWVWPPLLLALVAWMFVQARRQHSTRVGRALLYSVFAVLGLAAVGGGYETLGNATDPALSSAGHRLVDVGGYRLDIRCTGSGSPTVILEPGLGESARAMSRWIGPDVARVTRICAYDQAGHGRSDSAPGNHSDAARDLHILLERAHIRGPIIVAGHSLGGMYTLSYAHRYTSQIAGVVLLDSMHPKQTNAFANADPLLAALPTLSRTGIARLILDSKDGKPTSQVRQFVRDVKELPAEQNRASKLASLGDRPLAVITAGKGAASDWPKQQADLATLSSKSVHRTIAGATHGSLIDDKADAAQSSRAIREIVRAVRDAKP